jgi:hypothetical protein
MTLQHQTEAAINGRLDEIDRALREMDGRGEVNERYDEIEDEFVSLCIDLWELEGDGKVFKILS